MPLSVLRIGIAGALALHAIAHTIALTALLRQAFGPGPEFAARSWLLPNAQPTLAAAIAVPFWLLAAVAFATAALSFWGVAVPLVGWRQLAVIGAGTSLLGIAVLFGFWPGSPDAFYALLNTAVAVGMNLVVLGSQLWLHWPPTALFGK